jgi:hypothetical protein
MDEDEREAIRLYYGNSLANAQGDPTQYGASRIPRHVEQLERLKRENAAMRDMIEQMQRGEYSGRVPGFGNTIANIASRIFGF